MKVKALAATVAVALLWTLAPAAPAAAATGWTPAGPNDPVSISACRTTLVVSDVVNKVEYRTTTDKQGNELTQYRGTYVVSVAAPDGRRAVVDNSGPYSQVTTKKGDVFYDITAPGFIYAFDETEAAAFRAAGLPTAFRFTKGRLDLAISAAGGEKVLVKPQDPVSICTLLR